MMVMNLSICFIYCFTAKQFNLKTIDFSRYFLLFLSFLCHFISGIYLLCASWARLATSIHFAIDIARKQTRRWRQKNGWVIKLRIKSGELIYTHTKRFAVQSLFFCRVSVLFSLHSHKNYTAILIYGHNTLFREKHSRMKVHYYI